MKKSIWFIATSPFAANAFLREHLLALSKQYDVTLIVNLHAYPLEETLRQAITVLHIDIERKISFWADLAAFLRLLLWMVQKRPDAVHSITPKAGLLAMVGGCLAGIRLRSHIFTGQIWATRTGTKRWAFKQVDRLIVLCATHVFADSASQCRFLEEQGVVRSGAIDMLGKGSVGGVNLKRFRPDAGQRDAMRHDLTVSPGSTVFLFVGRIVVDKGVNDMLNAFKEVISRHSQCMLWIVGPDEGHMQHQLESAYADISAYIRWFGSTAEPEKYMMAADVLLLPSYREGFGSVIIEAAACEIPAIAYATEGVIDAVLDSDTGLLVKKGDVSGLASAMQRMIDNPAERARMGERARRRAEEFFSSMYVTETWMDFYKRQMR